MVLVEFYINDKLIDITDANKLGIRLNRQVFKPAEFTSKDAQMSYTITIPNTPSNNEIFNYANIEEVKNKFNYEYDAKLYVDTILVFDGKFMLNEITETTYKGNLYIPTYKTIKDIFGDRTMNAPSNIPDKNKWWLPFLLENTSVISVHNQNAIYDYEINNSSYDCIFPYVLYGLIPKVSEDPMYQVNGEEVGKYSNKNIYDEYARLGYEDIPPSMNVLATIQKMFKANDLTIEGTAFDDDRLKHLYMSYSNPTDYVQEWNYGDLSTIHITGDWSMADYSFISSPIPTHNYYNWERQISIDSDTYGEYYNINLFDTNRANLTYTDTGSNCIYSEYKDKYTDKDYTRKNLGVIIPKSGFYRVDLGGSIQLNTVGEHLRFSDNGLKFTSTSQSHSNRNNRFDRSRYEIQVLRDYGEGDFNNKNIVGSYNRANFPQDSWDNQSQYPKYYPSSQGAMVIDASSNQNFVCGLHWGRHEDDYNPKDSTQKCNYMFIQNGWSYNNSFTQKQKISSMYQAGGSGGNIGINYWRWGSVDGDDETATDDNDIKLDWGATTKRKGVLLDAPSNYINNTNDTSGNGRVSNIIWLEKGERLTINVVGDMGDMRRGSSHHSEFDSWITIIDKVNFELVITPFRTDITYNNFTNNGDYDSNRLLSWNDTNYTEDGFLKGKINLFKFLPSEIKVNDFLDNFCKAFNLRLSQPSKGKFLLDVKQTKELGTSGVVDFEDKFNIKLRSNEPLNLPSEIKIKFNVDTDEEGFVSSNNEDGSGTFETGTVNSNTLEVSSSFSYNWYKPITFNTIKYNRGSTTENVPIISKYEVWENPTSDDYAEMQKKWYTDLGLRFWYIDEIIGNNTDFSNDIFYIGSNSVKLMRVKNEYNINKNNILDYKNKQHSILNNYFTIITTNDTNYTTIKTYLNPSQYELLDGRNLIKLNSDLYYVSEISGYDPLMKNTSEIKLIRKI
ncbi:hypothetical protein [Dysgonomonas sp. 520]|uniref:hypothetical protein n=1 Tax=Dysgonomonas sp. 520 TaxID=2302931 RepID=UPI0013D2596E|nr:hypothetical protein [Dysgonomonas sp. 520]NDW10058.1 hypothetical protein [Dysgonomonas sp. 520]